MARNKGRKQRRTASHASRSRAKQPEQPAIPSRVQEIKAAHDEATGIATDKDMSAITDDPKPEGADLDAMWEIVREARDVFRSAKNRYERLANELDEWKSKIAETEASLDERTKQIDTREDELTARLAALDEHEGKVSDRETALTNREVDLRRREVNAEHGFDAERRAMLSELEASLTERRAESRKTEHEIAELRDAWHEEERTARAGLRKQLDAERETFQAELTKERQANEARLTERERTLEDREALVAEERRELEKKKRRLRFEEADLAELRADLGNRAEQLAAGIRETLEQRIRSLEDQLEHAQDDRNALESALQRRVEADRKFGQRTPEEVLNEIETLRARNDTLQAELAERPDTDAAARLAELEREQETWQVDRVDLSRQVSKLKRRLANFEADANEREDQRNVIASLESQRQLLHSAHEQVQAEIKDLLSRNEATSPFPACTAMDADSALQSNEPMSDDVGDLEAFVEDLQHRIASDPERSDTLYYTLADLRSFIGGLAMGPLVLLQGISGTGKTSLPMAFARAVGTKADVIEVQAGWRDPQDLVGHYNAFEKKFYEKKFLQALYRAGTPRWEDAIRIVLLDEMNLSHPEQYFSDLLSALELPQEDRRLVLMTHPVESAPSRLIEGRELRIPPNVWFVGTANHDETTMDFADKTYDRSHVMEFPHRPKPFEISKPPPRSPVSVSALQEAFRTAIQRRSQSANNAIEFLDSEIRDQLKNDFDVGWGPRLERQIHSYIPVVVAAGGSVGEATDHVLAMRLLRKLRNRHDNRPEHVETLKQRIEESWPDLDENSPPSRSLDLLRSELRRLGQAPENGE